MNIETPRKTAYYKKKQTEVILTAMGEEYFVINDNFWNFLAFKKDGNFRLIKSISANQDIESETADDNYKAFDKEIWRYQRGRKMPDISRFPKSA